MFRFRPGVSIHTVALASVLTLIPGPAMASLTAVGSVAPALTLSSQDGNAVSLSDYKGDWVVLYFYPKDESAGCTLEAHNFQRDLSQYEAMHAVILGVSLDTVASHKSFCAQDSLTFKLLADPNHQAIDAYGVPLRVFGAMHYAERTTFLISPQGRIVQEWTVHDISSHSAQVLSAIRSHGNQ